jgi:hypothetical protein
METRPGRLETMTTEDLKHLQAGDVIDAKVTDTPVTGNTVTGYGPKIPLPYMLRTRGPGSKWLRVYVVNYGNAGSAYVIWNKTRHYLSPGAELICETIRDGGTLQAAREKMNAWPEWMKVSEGLQAPGVTRYDVWTFEPHGSKPPAAVLGGLRREDLARYFPPGDVAALDTALAAIDAGAPHYSFTDVTGHYSQIRPAAPTIPVPADNG